MSRMPNSKVKATPEVDRMVDAFFAQALIRDVDGAVVGTRISRKELGWLKCGMKPPTVSPDLRDLISGIQQHPDHLPVLPQIELQWRERLGAMAQTSERELYAERVARLAPIDHLKLLACNPEDQPTEATLVAKMYLDGTYDTPRDPEYALNLLIEAAGHGGAEAAFLLASTRLADKTQEGLSKVQGNFLLENRRLRAKYLKQARAAGFQQFTNDELNARWNESPDCGPPVEYLKEQLERDADYLSLKDEYRTNLSAAQSGDSYAQYKLANNLLNQVDHLKAYHYDLFTEDKLTQHRLDELKVEARNWLFRASPAQSWASYQLATRFEEPEEERFNLLNSAASEPSPCILALVPLAIEFYMNPLSTHHDVNKGLSCLRQYLDQYESISLEMKIIPPGADSGIDEASGFGVWDEDTQAALCLADYVTRHPQVARGPEAYYWYSAVAAHIRNSAYAALQAGLMALRGDGCKRNLDRAKSLFDQARKSNSSSPRDARAARYAEALYYLGFELPGFGRLAVDLLLELAEETEFKGDPECSITPDDVRCLVDGNPNLQHYRQNRRELLSYRTRINGTPGPYGRVPQYPEIAEGLIWVIQAQTTIPSEALSALLDDDQSMLHNYVWARLVLVDRIAPSLIRANLDIYIEKIDQLKKEMDRNENSRTPDFHEEELAKSIWERTRPLVANRQAERAVEEDRIQTISFLSHTLVNATTGGAHEVLEITAKLARMKTTVDLTSETARLAAETSRMAMVESIVTVFKQYTARPEALTEMWAQDTGGSFSILQVVALSMRQALLRFYFAPDHEQDFQRLLPDTEYTSVAQEFLTDVAILDINQIADVYRFFEWLRMRLPFLRLDLDSAELEALHLHQGGTRAIVIFSLVGEFLANALKYTTQGGSILLSVRPSGDGLAISSSNSLDQRKPAPVLGGRTGLDFVRRVCKQIGADFMTPTVFQGNFSLGATLPIR